MTPEKNPTEKFGWNLMLTAFVILLFAGAAYFMARGGNHAYQAGGNALMIVGLGIYVVGRVYQWRGRKQRREQERR
jgi:hypothetical protein